MAHAAKILADSLSPRGVRLTTLEVTFPRIVLAEFNTHRMLSRNSASSRAIPIERLLRRVMDNPYIPSEWGSNQKGMQAGEPLSEELQRLAHKEWLLARDKAVEQAQVLLGVGLHKQLTNRLLEPFMWHTVIVTATEWSNFFNLRCHPHAHPDIRIAAEKMLAAITSRTPRKLEYGQWHLPLVGDEGDFDIECKDGTKILFGGAEDLTRISVGRCARVSYLTHDGKRDPQADIALHDRIVGPGHMSPLEHQARPATEEDTERALFRLKDLRSAAGSRWVNPQDQWHGNFRGWVQYRKEIPGEQDILGLR